MIETGLEKAQRINRERKEAGEQIVITHNWIVKARRKPASLKTAINAMCFHCVGGTEDELPDPGWKVTISTCTAPDCPLYPHRPYQKDTSDSEDEAESSEI